MSLCEHCQRVAAAREQNVRQLLYWQIEDMGINGASPIGLHIIDNFRPPFTSRSEMAKVLHDDEAIRAWLAETTGSVL